MNQFQKVLQKVQQIEKDVVKLCLSKEDAIYKHIETYWQNGVLFVKAIQHTFDNKEFWNDPCNVTDRQRLKHAVLYHDATIKDDRSFCLDENKKAIEFLRSVCMNPELYNNAEFPYLESIRSNMYMFNMIYENYLEVKSLLG